MLADAIEHLLANDHAVIAWNHGSTDETAAVLNRYRRQLLEATFVSRDVDFYDIYPLMSKHLLRHYVRQFDWISWPDQDEILEGPTRRETYRQALADVYESPHNWIQFHDFVFWHTKADDAHMPSPCRRIRHYSLARHGMPKIRSWRASATNMRWFNHNATSGTGYRPRFNLRHYPMRSPAQQQRRLTVDRANLRRGAMNYHYENMKTSSAIEGIAADQLHCDNGYSDLSSVMKFDWTGVYGQSPVPSAADAAYVLWTQRWAVAERVREALAGLLAEERSALGVDRLDRWVEALEVPGIPIRITVGGDPSAALVGAPGYPAPAGAGTAAHEGPIDWSIEVDADGTSGRVIVRPADGHACRNAPLVAVVPVGPGSPVFAYANHKPATFELSRGSYFLAIEPLGSVGVRFGVAAKCS